MRTLIGWSSLALGLAGAGVVWGCSDPFGSTDCTQTRTCTVSTAGAGGEAGTTQEGGGEDGQGSQAEGGAGARGGCSGDVSSDPTCWATAELGVFVSAETGSDDGDGTKENPFASISQGLRERGGKNVYVCSGISKAYVETVVVGPDEDGVQIYGGFDCDDWSYRSDRFAMVEAPSAAVALRVHDLEEGVIVGNLSLVSPNAVEPGASSIAAVVVSSKNVELRRTHISSGAGAAGTDGDAGAVGDDAAEPGAFQDGEASTCANQRLPGSWPAAVCGSLGGNGGEATSGSGAAGGVGIPITDVSPPNNANAGTIQVKLGEPGHYGEPGSIGNSGATGSAALDVGTFDSKGYTPADGADGTPGFPGQGGGGGSGSKGAGTSKICFGAAGGAGGMGGCAGRPGHGGAGGGASIGLLIWQSEVLLEECDVKSFAGGSGGAGGAGGAGGHGGLGGKGGAANDAYGIAAAGNGGPGGDGGPGGSGSGGTGGPSFAIAYHGPQPFLMKDSAATPGKGGKAGLGGKILGSTASDGSPGISDAVYQIP